MSDVADLRELLREYRRDNNLTQKALASRIGVSTDTIINYENGRSRPSPDIYTKLATEIGCDPNTIPHGTHRSHINDTELSESERHFAEEHHEIVLQYLKLRRLAYYDWYDVVIFGYLRAVKAWHNRLELHKYSFKIIAFKAMRSTVSNELRKTRLKTVSIYDDLPYLDGITYGDILCDPHDCVGI